MKPKKHKWKSAFYAGSISGLGLAAFLWTVETFTGHRVFVLLLNVDFIPLIGGISWPLSMELLFHLIISWVIAYVYLTYLQWKQRTNLQCWMAVLILSIGAGFTYFPLSELAYMPVPSATDLTAVTYWFIGHFLYAVLLKKNAVLQPLTE